MKNSTYQLETLSCPSCGQKIENALKKAKGVSESEVLFNSSRVKVSFDEAETSQEEVSRVIERLGYRVLKVK